MLQFALERLSRATSSTLTVLKPNLGTKLPSKSNQNASGRTTGKSLSFFPFRVVNGKRDIPSDPSLGVYVKFPKAEKGTGISAVIKREDVGRVCDVYTVKEECSDYRKLYSRR